PARRFARGDFPTGGEASAGRLPHGVGKPGEASWAALQELGDGPFELRQTLVDLDHLVRADGIGGIDVRLVLGPLGATLTAMEQITISVGAINVDRGVLRVPSAGTPALLRVQL